MADSRADLVALRERLEKADGPDREIDLALYNALVATEPFAFMGGRNPMLYPAREFPMGGGDEHSMWVKAYDPMMTRALPAYTASIDAALALVGHLLDKPHLTLSGPATYLNIPSPIPNYWWAEIVHRVPGLSAPRGWGATAPLCVLSALLRALESQPTQKQGVMEDGR